MAEAGVGLLVIVQKPWEKVKEDFVAYRETWAEVNEGEPPAPIGSGVPVVDEDAARAEELAHQHIGDYYRSVLRHYAFDEAPHEGVNGYEFYASIARYIGRHGSGGAVEKFVNHEPDVSEPEFDGVVNFSEPSAWPVTPALLRRHAYEEAEATSPASSTRSCPR
jgi:hypothetical protein